MSELYSDQYDSVSAGPSRSFPDGLRRLAGAALFLVLIAGMGIWAYRLGTRDAAEVPIIRALEGPARIQPADPGGDIAAHQGLEVNDVLAGVPATVAATATPLAPPPVLLTEEDGPQGELVIASPAPFDDAELLADDELRVPLPDEGPDAPLPADAAPDAAAGNTTELALAAQPTLEDAIAAAIEAEAATSASNAAAPPSGDRPRSRPSDLAPIRASAAAPAAAAPASAPAVREVAHVAAGARLVQLGAYDSEALTRQAWDRLVARHGDLLGGKSLYVERTTANARVFYRLRVAGFDSTAEAGALCEALRGRSIDCIPVTLR